jgi:hypothetical protein
MTPGQPDCHHLGTVGGRCPSAAGVLVGKLSDKRKFTYWCVSRHCPISYYFSIFLHQETGHKVSLILQSSSLKLPPIYTFDTSR